jgi:transcription elongation factor Elf1
MEGICAGLSHLRGRESSRVLNSRELGEMPNRFLCPKCHGQRTTSCAVCGGTGKRSLAGIPIGVCKECKGSGNQRCDVCGGTGEIEAADRT